jgi:glycosyltransferase involved in cell wall biosynthesis
MSDDLNRLPVLVARIRFGKLNLAGYTTEYIETLSFRHLLAHSRVGVFFCDNPSTVELIKLFLLKKVFLKKFKIVFFDLILRRPVGWKLKSLGLLKQAALKAADLIICIHKNTEGYEKYYGIAKSKFHYVPFTANNLDLVDKIASVDGDYIVSCGASHRDFGTLLKAVEPLGFSTKIILSEKSARLHNAYLGDAPLPECVERLTNVADRKAFNDLIARSRLVVIPILAETIQPAGVSVYLEAMALGKPVIVTRGSSVDGILDNELAMLVPPGDVEVMRQAIQLLWHSPAKRMELSVAGKRYALSLQGDQRMAADIASAIGDLCHA